jgi:hypothetical protein
MSIVREMRDRQTMTAAPERSGFAATLLIGCAAFAIGGLAIAGWKLWPGSKPSSSGVAMSGQPAPKSTSPATTAPTFSGKRLGEAKFAPLLRTCIKGDDFEGLGNVNNPDAVYTLLRTVGTASRVASLIGAETGGGAQLTDYWRLIADCVYQQNSSNLCDPDNRALAIESGGAFIRGAAVVAADPPKGRAGPMVLRDNAQSRERVLDALRSRVRNGYLIADDFGPIQPPEIKAILAQTKTVANGCAKP